MIKLIKNEYGDLVTPDTAKFDINLSADAPRPGITIERIINQKQVEKTFPLFQQYNILIFWLRVFHNDCYLDFKNLPNIEKLKYIEFDFSGKNCGFNLLKDSEATLDGLRELFLLSRYSINFNQYTNLKGLKSLTVQHHKSSSGWMEHSGISDLTIYKFKEKDLTSLHKMTSLNRLKLEQGSLKSLDGIENLKNLKTLHIHGLRNLTDLSALIKSSSIENLIFDSYYKNTDWDFLSQMKQLKLISLSKADSIGFFKSLPNLIVAGAMEISDGDNSPEYEIDEKYKDSQLPDIQRNIAVSPFNPFEDKQD